MQYDILTETLDILGDYWADPLTSTIYAYQYMSRFKFIQHSFNSVLILVNTFLL